jgi:thermostable 8-oxoguanine DNA glycosylase
MNRVMPRLKEAGYLNYSNLLAKLSDPERLRGELIEALGSSGYRMKNKGAKAIVKAVEVVSRRYGGDIHNIYRYANQKHDDKLKVAEEVWLELTKRGEFYWMGDKKAGVFLRDMVGYGVWDVPLEPIPPPVDVRVRRVLERLQLVKDGNDVEECRDAVLSLASELNIAPLELDVTLWIVGDENACGIKKPKHDRCPLKLYCPSKDKI